jgi:hypothetical protein
VPVRRRDGGRDRRRSRRDARRRTLGRLDIAPDSEQDAMPGDALPEGFDLRTADDEPTALPRYQIHVVLLDPDAIP